MIYRNTQNSVGLVSTWRCYLHYETRYEWRFVDPPTASSDTRTFAVDLPFDAVIKRVWLTMGISPAIGGSAYQRVNGISIPSTGEVELDKTAFSAETKEWAALFEFKGNGVIYRDIDVHEGRLSLIEPTLCIEYSSVSNPDDDGIDESVIVSRALDTGVQLPRLLDKDFHEVARIAPTNLRLEINLDPQSQAVMRVPPGEPEAQVGDFLELFSPHGSVGLFRVYEINDRIGYNEETTYYLEHAIATLEDSLAIGQQSINAPPATTFATLLETQNERHWVMGDCEVPEDYEMIYEYNYDNLLAAIMGLVQDLPPEYYWEFDTLRHPFVMHLRKLPETDGCELRLNRNLTYLTMTIDRSQLCTRVLPFGAGEGSDRITLSPLTGSMYLDSDTAETWGYVSRTFTAEDAFDTTTLLAVAERYLEKYKNPLISISGEAVDLHKATGESMDYFVNGALCRLALPDYGITMRERVISTIWEDVFNQPKREEVILSSRIRDASDEIADLMREATNSRLIGGSIETVEKSARAGNITPVSPFSQTFEVTGYGNVLNVKTEYRVVTAAGDEVNARITVDGNAVDEKDAAGRIVDITRYLGKDDAGVPTVGSHTITISPATLNTVKSEVDNTITVKQIKKR